MPLKTATEPRFLIFFVVVFLMMIGMFLALVKNPEILICPSTISGQADHFGRS